MKMKNLIKALCFSFVFLSSLAYARVDLTQEGVFSGRIVRVNEEAGLLRVAVDFENAKYLSRRDQVEFWHESDSTRRCRAILAGKSPGQFLFRIPDFEFCRRGVALNWGSYMVFESEDLANNMKMGRELIQILLTKRLALKGRLGDRERELQNHIERVNAVNKRYEALRAKLEGEWRSELASLEEDRIASIRDYEDLRIRLDELSFKLERYRQKDENLTEDRWSLDPVMYYKK